MIFSGKLLSFRDVSVAQAQTTLPRELRSLLILGRVSNLPTVWSNCLAGWLLSGGGGAIRFVLLCLGASAFLAYKDKAQWIWFAAFSLVAGFGGLTVLQTIGAWRLAAQG